MRTLQLLQSLSPRELKDVEYIVSNKKRESLKNLFGALKKNVGKKNLSMREVLYELSFGKKFQKKNDYLIRNELRLLNDILYEFLAMATFRESIRKTPDTFSAWLAKGIYERQLKEIFNAEIDGYIKESRRNVKPNNTAQLIEHKLNYLKNYQEKSVKNLESQLQLIDDLEKEDLRYFKYRIRDAEARKAYLYTELDKARQSIHLPDIRTGVTTPISTVDLTVDPADWFEEYLILKKQIYQTEGETKREVLKRMLVVGSNDTLRIEFSLTSQVIITMLLATELIFAEQFKEADLMLRDTLLLCETHKIPFPPSLLQNFMANKINMEAYEDAVKLYNKYEDKISKGPAYTITTLFLCYCYLFLNKPDKAISGLPEKTVITKNERYMVRIVYLIAFCLRGDYVLANNECTNLAKTMSSQKEEYTNAQIRTVALFSKYVKALLMRDEKGFAKFISERESDFLRANVIGDLGLRWLSRHL